MSLTLNDTVISLPVVTVPNMNEGGSMPKSVIFNCFFPVTKKAFWPRGRSPASRVINWVFPATVRFPVHSILSGLVVDETRINVMDLC